MNSQIKVYLSLVLLLLIVIFTVQNVAVVTINLFFWQFSVSRALMIFIVLIVGILLGWLGANWQQHRRRLRK